MKIKIRLNFSLCTGLAREGSSKYNLKCNLLSKNGRFLKLIENESVMINGHYQFPLRLQRILLDNGLSVMKHMQSLKKRF